MSTVTPRRVVDLSRLQADLRSFEGAKLVGVLVGGGSLILEFSNSASLLIQCPFQAEDDGMVRSGHGEQPKTAVILFDFLNADVNKTTVDPMARGEFVFGARRRIRIIPDDSGYESYVVRTSNGVFPV